MLIWRAALRSSFQWNFHQLGQQWDSWYTEMDKFMGNNAFMYWKMQKLLHFPAQYWVIYSDCEKWLNSKTIWGYFLQVWITQSICALQPSWACKISPRNFKLSRFNYLYNNLKYIAYLRALINDKKCLWCIQQTIKSDEMWFSYQVVTSNYDRKWRLHTLRKFQYVQQWCIQYISNIKLQKRNFVILSLYKSVFSR